MKTSENIELISAALVVAQNEIKYAAKDAQNPYLQNKYADLPSVIDAVKVALNNNGIVFIQTPGMMENMHLTLSTRLLHKSGQWIEGTTSMPLVKQDPQSYGSALTYARRYSLASITGLYQDDDDGYSSSNHAEANKPKPSISEERFTGAIKAISDGTYTTAKLRGQFALTPSQDAQIKQLEEAANVTV